MRTRLGRALMVAATVALALARAEAGDYHDGATLNCSECHVMHVSGTPLGNPTAQTAVLAGYGQVGEVGRLLRKDINELCLSCHDNSASSADVVGGNSGRFPGDVRQAGYLNRLGEGVSAATGHTLDALDAAPGSDPPWKPEDENGSGKGLNCINCHSHHGRVDGGSAYRNLRSDAGSNPPGLGMVSYNSGAPGSNDLARDVFVRRTRDYDESAVDFNEPDSTGSAMGRFCAGCHNLFHGLAGDTNIGGTRQGASFVAFLRHPDAGVNVGALGGEWSNRELFAARANRVKVMSEVGVWDPPGGDVTPTCISCHKAHGNGNAFGLIYRSGTGSLTEDGDSGGGALEHLCGQCHGQAVGAAIP